MEDYKTVMITNVDIHIMESDNPTLDRGDFIRMVCNTLDSKLEQTWRVRFHDDGTIAMYSFAMPTTEKNLQPANRLNDATQLPDWVQQRIAVLQICESGAIVDGVGQKVSEYVYYVIE